MLNLLYRFIRLLRCYDTVVRCTSAQAQQTCFHACWLYSQGVFYGLKLRRCTLDRAHSTKKKTPSALLLLCGNINRHPDYVNQHLLVSPPPPPSLCGMSFLRVGTIRLPFQLFFSRGRQKGGEVSGVQSRGGLRYRQVHGDMVRGSRGRLPQPTAVRLLSPQQCFRIPGLCGEYPLAPFLRNALSFFLHPSPRHPL